METIICQHCNIEHHISAQAICLGCHSSIFTSHELKTQIDELNKKRINLNFQIASLEAELFHRNRRKVIDYEQKRLTGNGDFYKNVRKAPRSERQAIKAETKEQLDKMAKELLALIGD